MALTSIGDLAQGMVLRARLAEVKRTAQILTEELATGRISDLSGRLGGRLDILSDIGRSLKTLEGYEVASREAEIFATGMQTALAQVQKVSEALAADLVRIDETSPAPQRLLGAQQARAGLEAVIGALNGRAAGRSLFAGTATDRAPLQSAQTLMGALGTAVAGAATADDIISAVETWFDDPSGFAATAYSGSDQDLAPFRTAPGEEVKLDLKADDPALRAILEAMALASLAADPSIAPDALTQSALLRTAGEKLFQAQDGLSENRAELGFAQSRIEEAIARNASSRRSFEMARNDLTVADPYETAARLQEAQFRLESIFAVTARTAGLSLIRFLE